MRPVGMDSYSRDGAVSAQILREDYHAYEELPTQHVSRIGADHMDHADHFTRGNDIGPGPDISIVMGFVETLSRTARYRMPSRSLCVDRTDSERMMLQAVDHGDAIGVEAGICSSRLTSTHSVRATHIDGWDQSEQKASRKA